MADGVGAAGRGARGAGRGGARAIYAYARREIAGWGKQGRTLVGEVVVVDALAPEAARRAQRLALLAAAGDIPSPSFLVCVSLCL